MEKEDILNYVDQTPGNTNRAVLGSMLNQLIEAGKELPPIETGDAGKVLTVNEGETDVEWKTPSGGGGSSNTYRALADFEYEHTITVPPTDAVALPTGGVWQVDDSNSFDHYLVDAEGNALTADDIEAVKIGDIILEQPVNEYYNNSYAKSIVVGVMDFNELDSDGSGKCVRIVYYSNIMGSGMVSVGYAFSYTAPNEPSENI